MAEGDHTTLVGEPLPDSTVAVELFAEGGTFQITANGLEYFNSTPTQIAMAGSVTAINSALAGLTYVPEAGFSGLGFVTAYAAALSAVVQNQDGSWGDPSLDLRVGTIPIRVGDGEDLSTTSSGGSSLWGEGGGIGICGLARLTGGLGTVAIAELATLNVVAVPNGTRAYVSDDSGGGDATLIELHSRGKATTKTGIKNWQEIVDDLSVFEDGSVPGLIISGHGMPPLVRTSTGGLTIDRGAATDITQAQLDAIKAKLKPDATIVISACNCGGDWGEATAPAKRVATKFGHTVIANPGGTVGLHGKKEWQRYEP